MKKILVLIEDTKQVAQTIEWALFHSGNGLGTIVLAHVIQPNTALVYSEVDLKPRQGVWEATKKIEHLALLEQKKYLEDRAYNVSIIEIDGARIKNLVDVVKDGDFDLIVLSAKGRSWLEDKIIGSPWSELINDTKVPIFIIPTFEKNVA